jgi:hypothetical protein
MGLPESTVRAGCSARPLLCIAMNSCSCVQACQSRCLTLLSCCPPQRHRMAETFEDQWVLGEAIPRSLPSLEHALTAAHRCTNKASLFTVSSTACFSIPPLAVPYHRASHHQSGPPMGTRILPGLKRNLFLMAGGREPGRGLHPRQVQAPE